MQLKYWGTAAAEGMPAIYCHCENCKKSRLLGGKNLRTRSQAMIDDTLFIDPNPDTFGNTLRYGFDLLSIRHMLVTHTHHDHFYTTDFYNRKPHFAHFAGEEPYPVTIYGSEVATGKIQQMIDGSKGAFQNYLSACTLTPFIPVQIEKYTVVPLPARHAEGTGPLMYQISADGKTLLYAHDTGLFFEEVWDYWQKNGTVFDFVSLDCTEACRHIEYAHHMNLERNIVIKQRMLEYGIATDKTVFCCNHFSHNGTHAVYDDFVEIAKKEGFLVSYDGMTVEI